MSLKEDLKTQAEEAGAKIVALQNGAVVDGRSSEPENQPSSIEKEVETKLSESVKEEDIDIDCTYSIGNWNYFMADTYSTCLDSKDETLSKEDRLKAKKKLVDWAKKGNFFEKSGETEAPDHPYQLIEHDNIKVVRSEDDKGSEDALAYYRALEGKITLHKYLPQDIDDEKTRDIDNEYKAGNPVSTSLVLTHENAHKDHFVYDGKGKLYASPINRAKGDRLTETVAVAAEYLGAAQTYENMKQQGIDTFVYTRQQTLEKTYEDYQKSGEEEKEDFVSYLKKQGVDTLHFAEKQMCSFVLLNYEVLPQENKPPLSDWLKARGINELALKESENPENGETRKMVSVDDLAEKLNQKGKSPLEIAKECGLDDSYEYNCFYDKKVEECFAHQEKGSVSKKDIKAMCTQGAYVSVQCSQPIESILEQFDGLKDVVLEEGFDAKDPQKVRKVVEAASKYWHTERQEGYQQQMLDNAELGDYYFSRKSWSQQMQILENEDKVYQEVSEKMLKDVYISGNTTVDLSSCRDLLDTLSTDEAKASISSYNKTKADGKDNCKISVMSLEEMKEVDAYLAQKGLKTDEDKMRYMSAYLEDMANRKGEVRDDGLTAILMKYDNRVIYEDGLQVVYNENGNAEAKFQNKTYYLTNCSVVGNKAVQEKTGENSRVSVQNAANFHNDGR